MDDELEPQAGSNLNQASSLLDLALATLVGDPCLAIGPSLVSLCKPIILLEESSASSSNSSSESVPPASLATWRCDGGSFFTLIRSAEQGTLVFCHSSQTLYFAAPAVQLAARCPDGTAFLCQFVLDGPQPEAAPRLLAFDVFTGAPGTPAERGERLRALGVHLPLPLCLVQWVGEARCLTPGFLSGLPHATRGVLVLGSEAGIATLVDAI